MVASIEIADDLWTRGAGHVLAAQALVEIARQDAVQRNAPDVEQAIFNGKYSASIHLLIGFSYELILKAAYLVNDGEQSKLKSIGHDLVAALESAQSVGFETSVNNLRWIMDNVREPHLRHHFRYGGPDAIQMPGLELTLPALEILTREIGDMVQQRK